MGHDGNESEVVRELIRERQLREQEVVREIEMIRATMVQAEVSGFADQSPAELLKGINKAA